MRVLIINEYCGTRSTGKIACEIAEKYERKGHEVRVAYGRNDNVNAGGTPETLHDPRSCVIDCGDVEAARKILASL